MALSKTAISSVLKINATWNLLLGFSYFGLMLVLGIRSAVGVFLLLILSALPLALASYLMTLRDEISADPATLSRATRRRCARLIGLSGLITFFYTNVAIVPLMMSVVLTGLIVLAAIWCLPTSGKADS